MSTDYKGVKASTLTLESPSAEQKADVIVVGAGPAGSSTAAFLAKAGLDVCLLEKSGFPREKVCGDGLTPRAVRMMIRLGIDTSEEAGWKRNKGLRIFAGGAEPLDMPWPNVGDYPDYGLVCSRTVFDDMLAGIAVASGARLYTETRVEGPLLDASGHVIGVKDSQGRHFYAPIVVAADGNSARLALQAGRDRMDSRPMGVAVRSYYRSPKSDLEWLESYLELWDGQPGKSNLLPGYGWVFGCADGTANVGLGMLNTSSAFGKTDYKALMKRWLDATPAEWGFREENRLEPIRGAALPMAFNRQPFYADGLLLVGDAAGMISPFNGEGISYAMESGQIAAECIADAKARGFNTPSAEVALEHYVDQIKAEWGGYYRLGTIFVKLIGNPHIMQMCTKYGLPHARLMRFVHKLLANLPSHHHREVDDLVITILSRLAPST